MAGAIWNCCHLGMFLCIPYSHAPASLVTSCKATYRGCMHVFFITDHLHILAEQWDLLHTTVVTWWWNGYRSKSQHGKLTLESGALTTELSQLSHWREIYFLLPLPCLCFIWSNVRPEQQNKGSWVHGYTMSHLGQCVQACSHQLLQIQFSLHLTLETFKRGPVQVVGIKTN